MKKTIIACLLSAALLSTTSCEKTTDQKFEEQKITKEYLMEQYKQAGMKMSGILLPNIDAAGVGGFEPGLEPGFELTEAEAQAIVQPLMTSSTSYLMQNYGINLSQYFAVNDPRRALIGKIALRLEELGANGQTVDDPWFSDDIPLTIENDLYDCVLEALGISAALEVVKEWNKDLINHAARNKALRKMIVKVASRYLSFIGVAIAAYEVGDCMDWW